MTTTIAANSTLGVSLTLAAQNPVQVNAGVTLASPVLAAIYGSNAATWTIANLGTLQNQAAVRNQVSYTSYYAIDLAGGGVITNGATNDTTALISAGAATAIRVVGSGSVVNFGTVDAVTAGGTTADGIDLKAGGVVVNGPIQSVGGGAVAALIQGARFGVYSSNIAGVAVRNAGTIRGAALAGVDSRYGSPVDNGVYGATGALISGGRYGVAVGAAAMVTNLGTITATGTGGNGVRMFDGGTITNGVSGSHAGLIAGSALSNIGGGAYGVQLYGTDMTALLRNFGSITGATGVLATFQATIANAGTLSGRSAGVYLRDGALLSNAAGASVTSANYAVQIGGDAGSTLINAGTISGALGVLERANDGAVSLINTGTIRGQYGLQLASGGSVVNSAGGLITGGIFAQYVALMVSNLASISGLNGVVLLGGGSLGNGALINGTITSGTITGGTNGTGAYVAGASASIANFGLIQGGIGVQLGADATLTNQGRVLGGVSLAAAATVVNAGSIAGVYGLTASGSASLANTGKITGTTAGLRLAGGGSVVNGAPGGTASITGVTGVVTSGDADVTIANAGTITGTGGTAVSFTGAGNNRLVLLPGASLGGVVTAATSGSNVIELAGSVGNSGSISGLGGPASPNPPAFANFQSVSIDPGVTWSLTGTNTVPNLIVAGAVLVAGGSLTITELTGAGQITVAAAGTLDIADAAASTQTVVFAGSADLLLLDNPGSIAAALAGFVTGDTIDLTGFSHDAADAATLLPGNTLHIAGLAGSLDLPMAPTDNFTGQFFHLTTDDSAGSNISVDTIAPAPCFASGTRIATPYGPVPVEALRSGDSVLTADGRIVVVTWIGHRRVATARHCRPQDVHPVHVQAHAFAPGLPSRTLRLSPDHAVARTDARGRTMLIPIRYLLNGATIRQVAVASVTYFHVELPRHEVILAEDLPCESYLDTGNRFSFREGPALQLHPDFARPDLALAIWATQACAELVTQGPRLAAIRAQLLARALTLGHRRTTDPALHSTGTNLIHLRSRAAIPAELCAAHPDGRRLGVALGRITIDGIDITLDDPRLTSGWHEPEPGWRWTDGDACIDLKGATRFAYAIVRHESYWEEESSPFLQQTTQKLLSV